MNGYTCAKTLTLSGIRYEPGDPVPAEAVLPNRVRALKNEGFLTDWTEQQPSEGVPLSIVRDGSVMNITASPDSVAAAVWILQLTAEESVKAIETTVDETVLILIHALDSRKSVKAAAQTRAETLRGGGETG